MWSYEQTLSAISVILRQLPSSYFTLNLSSVQVVHSCPSGLHKCHQLTLVLVHVPPFHH